MKMKSSSSVERDGEVRSDSHYSSSNRNGQSSTFVEGEGRENVWSLYRRAADRFDADVDTLIPPNNSNGNSHRQSALSNEGDNSRSTITPSRSRIEPVLSDDYINKYSDSFDSSNSSLLKKFKDSRNENNYLLRTVRDQQKEIDRLKAIVKSLQSDVDSSESRQEKSCSTSSSLPVVRVTPQKRISSLSSNSSSSRTAARRLFEDDSNGNGVRGSEDENVAARHPSDSRERLFSIRNRTDGSTPIGEQSPGLRRLHRSNSHSYPRRILQEAGLDSDVLESSSATVTPETTPGRPTGNRPVPVMTSTPAVRRQTHRNQERRSLRPVGNITLSSSNTTIGSRENRVSEVRDSNATFVVNRDESSSTTSDVGPSVETGSPGYYLRLMRPDFIRRLEYRQSVIRAASEQRLSLEAQRKFPVRALATGAAQMEEVADLLLIDPTQIRAFPEKDMKAITRRKIVTTSQYRNNVLDREKKIEKTTNRIMAMCYSASTRRKLQSSDAFNNSH